MFMQHQKFGSEFDAPQNNENVYCLIDQQEQSCNPSCNRYKSSFAAKVRWDSWLEKKGCCKTIGPPPKICIQCPEHFLRKHSRQVPVFFTPEELRVTQTKDSLKKFVYEEEPVPPKRRNPPLNTGLTGRILRPGNTESDDTCPFPRPPSRLGLFRSPHEPPYEQKYKLNPPQYCPCDSALWEELLHATEQAGIMAARMEKQGGGGGGGGGGPPTKDYIRANAIHAIRMPARKLRRCYVDPCGVHLMDMSDAPYVLRPNFGKVPAYLCRRKQQLLQEDMNAKSKLMRNVANVGQVIGTGATCAPNQCHDDIKLVNEQDKNMVINGLKDYWADLLNQYNALPLNGTGNERQRELKHDLEERMKEVEGDLRLLTTTSTLFVGDVKSSHYL